MVLASKANRPTHAAAAAAGHWQWRDSRQRITPVPLRAHAPRARKIQMTSRSLGQRVSHGMAGEISAGGGDVKLWRRSPAVNTRPLPRARFLDDRYVM